MSRILRFFAFVFGVFCVGNVLAAGYSCPTYKQYTSCAVGYYMTSNASSTTYNGTPAVGNACRPCSVMGQYNNIDKYTCPGGTAAPVKKTVKVTYVLNGGSGTTPAATTCNFGEACSLNPGTGTSYRRAGYRLVGWSTASSTTSGAFSMVLTANTTVYAVWTRCAEGTYKTASATPASACATMSYGYHGTGCDSSYMACTGQAQCTGTTFCEQHIKQECPDPNNEENRREIFPEEYSGSQMVGGKVVSANGRGAITECMALVWYDPDPNVTDGQTVGLHEYVFVEGDTKRYQGEVSSWLYDAVGPGYYLTDESGCDEGYASYKSVDICPVGAACPGKERVECDSSNEATVLTETFGLEICTDGNTTSSTGSIKCDSACSNVIGAATWTTPTWSPSTRQVLDKCAINTCSTGYTRSGSASSTAPASYTCSANCNKVTLNGIKNGGSGTTTLYKKTGLATWYSDNACSDVVTKLSPLPTKPNASYAGHYNTSAASGGTQCVTATGTFKTAAACNVSGNTTFYAQYKCDSNYLGSGTRIAGACTGTVRTIYLKSYDGSATHSTIYQKYATGWYSNSAATNEISKADIPSRDGYTFRGFYTSKQTDLTASGGTGTRRITANGTLPANTTFTSNANLFAAWAHNCIQPSNGTCTLTISDTGTVTYTTTCNAGHYISGAGTYNPTCTPCGDGTYSAGGTATSCTTCPGEYTHSDGTRAAIGNCYLTTVAGKYVATANANQITCDNTTAYYYPGGTKVYYGGTGGNVPLIKGEWNAVNTGGTCASKEYCPAGTWGSVAGTCDSIPAGSYPGAASGCATKDDAGDYIGCSGYEACSSLPGVSVSGGTYTSAAGSKNSKACKYTAPSKTITGCSTVTTNTVTYTGTAWPATTYGVTATGGYVISGNNTAAATCTQCSGAVWSAGGTATSCSACPAQTSGWTRNSGTGWTAVTQCNQTKSVGGNCSAGVLKQNATSTTAWGETTISTALQAKPGYIVSGQTCTGCAAGTYSAGGAATSCSACTGRTQYSAAHASSCSTVSTGYYTTGCNTSNNNCTGQSQCTSGTWCSSGVQHQCSSLTGVSVSGGTYTSAAGSSANTSCKYTAPSKTITGCSTVTTNTVTYTGTAWPATTYGVTATGGYVISGNNTAAATCTQCSGAVWSAGGTATSCSACPAQTSGWTRNSGTGWTAVTQCNQTKSVGGNCSAGVLKQNATSTTAWGETTISTALQAKPGYIVSGQTCTGCAAGTYSAGGTATSCSACTGRTHYSAAHAASCSTVSTGYYTTGCNTSNNNCTGQSQCTSGTWCSSGVQHQCSSLTGVSVSGGTYTSAAGSSANTSCKYTAPSKTITGCSTVTTNTVTYTGTAWPVTTYGVTATGGYVISGNNTAAATCTQCSGAVWSAGGTATSCSACPAQTSGWTRNSGTGWTAVTQCNQTKTGTAISSYCASGVLKQNATSATAWGETTIATALSAKAGSIVNGQTCEQCSGAVWSAGGTATSCSACPAQTSGWTRNSGTGWTAVTQCNQTKTGTAISSYCASGVLKQNATSATAWGETTIATALSAKAGSIVNGQTCEQCSGAVWSAGGTATSCSACPAQTSGWTRNSGTGWTAVTQCNQTKTGVAISSYCASGVLKQNATSTTVWGATTIATALQAKPGYIVSGQTCTGCAAGTYSAGGAATSCSACTGRTQYSAAHAASCSTVSTGYYTTGCNTSNNNCTGQSQCTSGTWCSSGVQHQCSSLTGVSVSGGTYTSAAGSSANTSCKYTAPSKTITGCSTVITNTVTYTGTAWPATTYGVTATGGYIISGNNTAAATCTQCGTAKYSAGGTATSCSACPTADSGWTATSPAGSSAYTACYEYQTPVNCASGTVKRAASSATAYSSTISLLSTLKSKAGYYASTTAISCTICPAGSSCAASATAPTTCANWTYAASAGMASCTACPVLTSGWTKANSTGTGWSSHTNCVQISPTPAGCASGNNKQVAASNGATTWGPATVNTELSAKAGYIVSGTTCPICTGATYSAGGTATSCTTCPSIYTSDNTNGKTKNSECKVTTNAGKYIATAGDNTQTICPVKHYCPSASVAYGATNSPTACPAADSTTERTTYPADYLNPTRTTFVLQGWGNGLGAITSCMAYYSFTNSAGRFNVESVHYNSTTGKYDVGGGKYYTVANPGWYMVDKYSSTYCNTSTRPMYYHNVAECPANSYCPGYSSMPLCSTGTYEDEMGKFACSSLGTGAYTKSPAKSGPATACYLTTTATNFVKTAKAAEEKCTAGGYCAGGTKVNWGSTGGRTPASAGYYVSGTGATSQTACAAGTYTDTTGKTTCTSAVAGTHTTGCQVAASGSSTKTLACTGTAVCATNTYSSAKASACTACATAKGYTNSGTTAAAHAELASCKATCSGGQYVATAGAGCVNVGTGYYGAGGTVGQNATLARNQCPTGQTTIGYGAGADEIGDCGRILHIGDNKVYLRNTKKTTPSLNVKVGDTTYYGNMTSGTSKGKLRVKNGTTTYSVHDDSM